MDDAQLTVEKRRFPRVSVSLQAKYKVITDTPEAKKISQGREALACHSANLSKGGVALLTEIRLAKGDLIKVELTLPGTSKPIKAFAEVKWSQAASGEAQGAFRTGIVFMALRREDEEILETFVRQMASGT